MSPEELEAAEKRLERAIITWPETAEPGSGEEASASKKPASGSKKQAYGSKEKASGSEKPASGANEPASGSKEPASGLGKNVFDEEDQRTHEAFAALQALMKADWLMKAPKDHKVDFDALI